MPKWPVIDETGWDVTRCDGCGGPLRCVYPRGTSRHYCSHECIMTEGKKYEIPEDAPTTACRSCGATIVFVRTERGRNMPVTLDGISHFATCNDPKRFRKKERNANR